MSRYILDTSFISSFTNIEDSNHVLAKKIFSKIFVSDQIFIPSVVFAELAAFDRNKLFRDKNLQLALRLAKEIPSINNSNILKYISFIQKVPYTFTAIDSIVLFLAIENKAEFITFDTKLRKLYSSTKRS